MSPTPAELELGAKAYQQTRFYEKHTARNMRQLPWIFAGLAVLLVIMVFVFKIDFKRYDFSFFFPWAPIVVVLSWAQNRLAKESYTYQKMLLKLLEEKYGDLLPWVIEEKELARAGELEAAIAREQHQAGHA